MSSFEQFNIDDCIDCKECEEICTIFKVLGKYSPQEKIKAAKKIMSSNDKPEDWETVYFCNKCEACDVFCSKELKISNLIDESRKLIVEKWGIQYPKQKKLIKNIFDHGNPFGKTEKRLDWIKEFPSKSKILLHIGCMMSYPLQSMGKSLINVLNKLEVDYTINENEPCCGYFIYNTGDHVSARKIINQNIEFLEQYDQLITACAGCYTFFKQKYELKIPVKHVIEIINEELSNKDIDIFINNGKEIIFHDSCHLTRPHGIVEEPRNVLKKMGFKIKEFESNKEMGLCCGADGGMRIINPEFARVIGRYRVEKAKEKADTLMTLCPFCNNNFMSCSEHYKIDLKIGNLFEDLNNLLKESYII